MVVGWDVRANERLYADFLTILGVENRMAAAMLDAAIPLQVPGGCDHCDAYQRIQLETWSVSIVTHHDDWCPFLAEYETKPGRRAS